MPTVQRRSPAPGTTESPAEVPVMENVAPVEQPVKVALLLPLSGRLASLGKAMADAAQMALFDLADLRFQLLPLDDKGTAAGSVAAANDAIAQGAQMIIGPLLGASVSAVAPIAQAAGVPVVAFSSDRKVAAPGVYIIGFTPDAEVQRVVDFAALGGLTRFALAAPNSASTAMPSRRRCAGRWRTTAAPWSACSSMIPLPRTSRRQCASCWACPSRHHQPLRRLRRHRVSRRHRPSAYPPIRRSRR
ncbi:MAG: penicillin-binding protein activator [Rhodospirillales bacterium]